MDDDTTGHGLNVTADTQDLRQVAAMLADNGAGQDEDATIKMPTMDLMGDDATIQMPPNLLAMAMPASKKAAAGADDAAAGGSRMPEGDENMVPNKGGKRASTSTSTTTSKGPLAARNPPAPLGDRRQTADMADLEGFFDDIKAAEGAQQQGGEEEEEMEWAAADDKTVAMPPRPSAEELAERRETADPESLRYLLTLLRSPGGTGVASRASLSVSPSQAIEKILGPTIAAAEEEHEALMEIEEGGTAQGGMLALANNTTADTSQLERLIVDLETSLTGAAAAAAAAAGENTADFFVSPIARRRSSIMARRLTADPELLEDLINELTGGLGMAGAVGGRQSTAGAVMMTSTTTTTTTTTTTIAAASTHPNPTNDRRATASPGDLNMLLDELPGATTAMAAAAASAPAPGATYSMSPPPQPPQSSSRKALRSCLSSKKQQQLQQQQQQQQALAPPTSPGGSATKKSVVFGSPNAAYFHKMSPSNSLTPMTKRDVARIFPQQEEAEGEGAEMGVTAENTAILAQWNAENGEEEEEEEEANLGGKRKRISKSPRPKRRQSLMLPAGSPGFMNYRAGGSSAAGAEEEEEEDEEDAEVQLNTGGGDTSLDADSIGGNSLNEKLEKAEEDGGFDDEDDTLALPMELQGMGALSSSSSSRRRRSSGASNLSHEEEMPDLEDRSSPASNSFRELDQRTSSQLGIMGPDAAAGAGVGGGGGGQGEERTMELETDLQSLVQNLPADAAKKAAAAVAAAEQDRTLELEGNLQDLMQQVGKKKAAAPPMGIRMGYEDSEEEEEAELQDATNTTTFNATGEEIRLSLGSPCLSLGSQDDDSDAGADATRTSVLEYHKQGAQNFSLSFAGNNEEEEEEAEEAAAAQMAAGSGKTGASGLEGGRPTTFDTSAPGEEEEEEEEQGEEKATMSTLSRSSTGSAASSRRRSSGEGAGVGGDTTSSPFAHIVVGGRLRGAGESNSLAVSSSSSGGSGASSLSMAVSVTDEKEGGQCVEEVTPMEVVAAPGFDWTRVTAFREAEEANNLVRLVETVMVGEEEEEEGKESESSPPTPVALLQQAAREALLENCEQVATNLMRQEDEPEGTEEDKGMEFPVPDMGTLQQTMAETFAGLAVDGGEEEKAALLEQLVGAVVPRLDLEWRSLESQLLQMVRMRVKQEADGLQGRATDLAADMERVSGIDVEVQEAIAGVQAQFRVLRAQRKDAARQHRLDELEAQRRAAVQAKAALEAQEKALAEEIAAEEQAAVAREAEREVAAKVQTAVQEKLRVAESVRALEEQGRVLRGLHLWQPLALTSEEMQFAFAHPDGSRTEVRMLLQKAYVTEVQVCHKPPPPGRNRTTNGGKSMVYGPNSRALLQHMLRSLPVFASTEPPPALPTVAVGTGKKVTVRANTQVPQTWSWEALSVDVAEVPGALGRLERLLGRAHLLMETVARVEAAHPCSLVVGESAVRQEGWVEECLYGACTTCRFDHGHTGAGGGSHIRLPQCAAVLVATLAPPSVKNGTPKPPVQAKFLLSLAFLSAVPLRMEPALPGAKLCLQKVEALLTNRLGVPPHHPISIQGREGWQATNMLLEACRCLREEGLGLGLPAR